MFASCVLASKEQSLPHTRFAALSAINRDSNYIIKLNDSVGPMLMQCFQNYDVS